MCSATVQIHWGEGGGPNVDLRTRDVQEPRRCCAAVTGRSPLITSVLKGCHVVLYYIISVFSLQAAMDFLVEENLKARVSCWYIKKYIEDHPLQHYKNLVIT